MYIIGLTPGVPAKRWTPRKGKAEAANIGAPHRTPTTRRAHGQNGIIKKKERGTPRAPREREPKHAESEREQERKPTRPDVFYSEVMVLNVVPEAIVYGQIALSKLRRGPHGIPAQLRVELFKKDPVVALVMPKSTVKIKKKMSHGSKVDAQAREK